MFVKKYFIFFVGLLIILLLIPVSFNEVYGQEVNTIYANSNEDMEKYQYLTDDYALLNDDDLPINYPIGITLLRIGAIDREVGSYEADFWLWIEIFNEDSPIDFTENPPEFDFTNAREVNIDVEQLALTIMK